MNDKIDNDDKYLSKQQVAGILGKSIPTINNYMKREGMPFYKVGRSVLFKRGDIDEWVGKHKGVMIYAKTSEIILTIFFGNIVGFFGTLALLRLIGG